MNKTDKDFIESKLRKAISLVYKDQTAQALREIADAVSVVAVALESKNGVAQAITVKPALILDHAKNSHEHKIITTDQGDQFATGRGRVVRGSVDHTEETRRITEKSALDTVKPLCPSGLLAGLSDGGNRPQCPACGLFHERRVVVVELSSLGLHMLKHEGAMRIGGGEDNPDKYRQDDRVIFTEHTAPLKGDVILGDVVKMFSGPYGREASIEVVKS